MHPTAAIPFACFLSMIRPPGIEFENSYLQILPIDKAKCPIVRNSNDVGFRLYTRHNPTVYEELFVNDDKRLAASHIDFKDPTMIFFHAFLENPDTGSALMMREAYILRGDTNVIMVDAQRLEAGPWYFTAAENTWYIGQFAARFVDYLVSRGLDLSKLHLVGHSLGAQAAGVAGAAIHSGRVARITGLDPASPLFEKLPLEQKLDPSDAQFVDVIHTDAGIFGVHHPMGHVDFYPNGGISPQPGCELEVIWPKQQLLEKCPTHITAKPLKGYLFFELEADKQKERLHNKMEKYFGYSKRERKLKRPEKIDKYAVVKNEDTNQNQNGVKEQTPEIELDRQIRDQNTEINVEISGSKEREFSYQKIGENLAMTQDSDSKLSDQNIAQKFSLTLGSQKSEETHPKVESYATHTKKDLSQLTPTEDLEASYQDPEPSYIKSRQKRFISFFKRTPEPDPDNFLFKMMEFLVKNRKNIVPVVSVMREINTLVKSANGELMHSSKERNNYIGTPPPFVAPVAVSLELGQESGVKNLLRRILGLGGTDKLSVGGAGVVG